MGDFGMNLGFAPADQAYGGKHKKHKRKEKGEDSFGYDGGMGGMGSMGGLGGMTGTDEYRHDHHDHNDHHHHRHSDHHHHSHRDHHDRHTHDPYYAGSFPDSRTRQVSFQDDLGRRGYGGSDYSFGDRDRFGESEFSRRNVGGFAGHSYSDSRRDVEYGDRRRDALGDRYNDRRDYEYDDHRPGRLGYQDSYQDSRYGYREGRGFGYEDERHIYQDGRSDFERRERHRSRDYEFQPGHSAMGLPPRSRSYDDIHRESQRRHLERGFPVSMQDTLPGRMMGSQHPTNYAGSAQLGQRPGHYNPPRWNPFDGIKRHWGETSSEMSQVPYPDLASVASNGSSGLSVTQSSILKPTNLEDELSRTEGRVQALRMKIGRLEADVATGAQLPHEAFARILVPCPLDGQRLGLTLRSTVVEGFADLRAQQFGWLIGDRILQVNGQPVANTAEFARELSRAMGHFRATGGPLIFDVVRGSGALLPPGSVALEGRAASPVRMYNSPLVSPYASPLHSPLASPMASFVPPPLPLMQPFGTEVPMAVVPATAPPFSHGMCLPATHPMSAAPGILSPPPPPMSTMLPQRVAGSAVLPQTTPAGRPVSQFSPPGSMNISGPCASNNASRTSAHVVPNTFATVK